MARQFATALDDAVFSVLGVADVWAFIFGRGLVGRDRSGASGRRIRMAENYHCGFIYYDAAVGLIPLCAQPFRAGKPCFGRRGRNGVLLGNGTLFVRLVHGQL